MSTEWSTKAEPENALKGASSDPWSAAPNPTAPVPAKARDIVKRGGHSRRRSSRAFGFQLSNDGQEDGKLVSNHDTIIRSGFAPLPEMRLLKPSRRVSEFMPLNARHVEQRLKEQSEMEALREEGILIMPQHNPRSTSYHTAGLGAVEPLTSSSFIALRWSCNGPSFKHPRSITRLPSMHRPRGPSEFSFSSPQLMIEPPSPLSPTQLITDMQMAIRSRLLDVMKEGAARKSGLPPIAPVLPKKSATSDLRGVDLVKVAEQSIRIAERVLDRIHAGTAGAAYMDDSRPNTVEPKHAVVLQRSDTFLAKAKPSIGMRIATSQRSKMSLWGNAGSGSVPGGTEILRAAARLQNGNGGGGPTDANSNATANALMHRFFHTHTGISPPSSRRNSLDNIWGPGHNSHAPANLDAAFVSLVQMELSLVEAAKRRLAAMEKSLKSHSTKVNKRQSADMLHSAKQLSTTHAEFYGGDDGEKALAEALTRSESHEGQAVQKGGGMGALVAVVTKAASGHTAVAGHSGVSVFAQGGSQTVLDEEDAVQHLGRTHSVMSPQVSNRLSSQLAATLLRQSPQIQLSNSLPLSNNTRLPSTSSDTGSILHRTSGGRGAIPLDLGLRSSGQGTTPTSPSRLGHVARGLPTIEESFCLAGPFSEAAVTKDDEGGSDADENDVAGTGVPLGHPEGSRECAQTPDVYSGAFGRLKDFRGRLNQDKKWLMKQNPTAFQEEAAAQAEADYRARAEYAHMKYAEVSEGGLVAVSTIRDFYQSVKMLQSERPFFVPPVLERKHVERCFVEGEEVKVQETHLWKLEDSIFFRRRAEAEARDYYDNEKVKSSQFRLDWSRIAAKSHFRKLVGREDKGVKEGESLDEEIGEVREELSKYKDQLRSIFNYYSMIFGPINSESAFVMGFNTWMAFGSETGIINEKGGCKRADAATIFVTVNFEEAPQSTENMANEDDAMMRFEFYEGIIRLAFKRFVATQEMDDASDATDRFITEIMIPSVPPEALVDPNVFRETRMYTEEMEELVEKHWTLLWAMHKLYRARDRTKYFWVEHWGAFLVATRLMGPHTGVERREAKLIFAWSQMIVSDELRRRKRSVSLTFFDFVEAIGRTSDFISPPSQEELEEWYDKRFKVGNSNTTSNGRQPNDTSLDSPKQGITPRPSGISPRPPGISPRLSAEEAEAAAKVEAAAAKDLEGLKAAAVVQDKEPSPAHMFMAKGGNLLDEYFTHVTKNRGIKRRPSASLLAVATRPLHVKFAVVMGYISHQMRAMWQGVNEQDCANKMVKMAIMINGGVELG